MLLLPDNLIKERGGNDSFWACVGWLASVEVAGTLDKKS